MRHFIGLFLIIIGLFYSCESNTEAALSIDDPRLKLDNGQLYLDKDVFEGHLIDRYDSDSLKSKVYYALGRKQGIEQLWFKNGSLAIERDYSKGIKIGIHKAWWENGNPKFEYHFDDHGAYHGSVLEWYESGALYRSFNYSHGKEDGRQTMKDINGKIKANYDVVNGERFGLVGLKKCDPVVMY